MQRLNGCGITVIISGVNANISHIRGQKPEITSSVSKELIGFISLITILRSHKPSGYILYSSLGLLAVLFPPFVPRYEASGFACLLARRALSVWFDGEGACADAR